MAAEIKLSGTRFVRLFETIGGDEGLEKILKRFYQKMARDLLIGFFFEGRDTDAIARQQKAFLSRAWGVTRSYQGKAPADAHDKLAPILAGHFDRRLRILEETLREFSIDGESIRIWVEFEKKFREAIVTVEKKGG